MFRITRGITIDPAPAYPSPLLRFPDGARVPVHPESEIAATPEEAPRPAEPAEQRP